MYILSQVLVAFADLLYVCSMISKKKSWLVVFLIFSDILFALHYLCLNALTGCFSIFVDVVFLIVIFLLEKIRKEKYNLLATIFAMIAIVTICVLTWNGPISLLPLFSMLIYLTGMIFTNVVFVKAGAMCRNILNIVYMVLITSYVGAGLEFALMLSAIIGIILNVKNKTTVELNNDCEKD